jgi:hypothetical protein
MAKRKKNVPGQGTAQKLQFVGNTPTNETFDILYDRYSKAYDSVKGKLRAGQQMYLTKRNKMEFREFYMAVANETPISDTPAATANQIINRMVEESRYEFSNIQARNYKKGLMTIGVQASIIDIREGREDHNIRQLEDELKDRNKQLKNEGKSGYERAHIIGQEFFGSPS